MLSSAGQEIVPDCRCLASPETIISMGRSLRTSVQHGDHVSKALFTTKRQSAQRTAAVFGPALPSLEGGLRRPIVHSAID